MLASDPRFTGIGPLDPTLIGQAAYYEAVGTGDGAFRVTVRIGWGDCEAGCINKHIWVFRVAGADGALTLESETGREIPPGVIGSGTGTATLDVLLVAGPVCPVVRDPPDPACDARPVAGATVIVRDETGAEVARLTSDAAGHARGSVPPGRYVLEALPSPAAMSVPAQANVSVAASGVTPITMEYDTGIR